MDRGRFAEIIWACMDTMNQARLTPEQRMSLTVSLAITTLKKYNPGMNKDSAAEAFRNAWALADATIPWYPKEEA